MQGCAVSDGAGGWLYQLDKTKGFAPGAEVAQDMTYFDRPDGILTPGQGIF